MPIYSVRGPDGRIYDVEGPAGASEDQIISAVRRQILMTPAATQDTSGFKAAAAAGLERLKGQTALTAGKLGLMDVAEAERYQKEREQAAQARFTPTQEGWTEAPFQKFKETLGGSLPYMVAPAAAGLAALAAPVSVPAAAALGAGAAGLTSAAQFTGSNIARQMETGKTLEEASLGQAVSAAVPQALLDTAAMALMPGVGKLFGSVGSKLTNEQAKAIASQTLGRTVADYAAKTGAAVGREGVTEATQQLLERLQAGLNISDKDARAEYIESFIGGAALAGAGAPIGRAFERSSASKQAQEAERQEQAKAAAEAEAAKNAPDALRQLDTDYRAALQQVQALNAQVDAAKPTKGATDEQKKAYDGLKQQRTEFINSTFKPLKQEYEQRKDAITKLYEDQQAVIEAEVAPTQEAAVAPVPAAEPKRDVQQLMLEQDSLRQQMAQLETQLGQAAPEQFDALNTQRQNLQRRIDARATMIEELGGSPLAQTEFEQATAAKMQALDARMEKLNASYATALENKDYDAAAKAKDDLLALRKERSDFTAKTAQQMQALQEKQAGLTGRGQTRELFGEMPAQPEAAGVKYVSPEGKPIEPFTATAKEAAPAVAAKPEELAKVQTAETNRTAAQTELIEATKAKDTPTLYAALDKRNQAENEVLRAQEDVGRPTLKPVVLDLFDPGNIIRTAYSNGDAKLLNDVAAHADRTALIAALDEKANDRERLVKVLGAKLDTEGTKRERANLFAKLYDAPQQALFKNGTYPDKDLQALYDKGGPAAVEYERVMRDIETLSKQVTTKQGNAKQSLYEQLVDIAAQHAALTAQMESGIATPTMREKAAGLQAKLGKGEAAPERQMDASEKYQLQRKIDSLVNKYKLVEGKVAPVREQIIKLHNSLYTTTKLEKPSVVAEKKAKEAKAAARGPKVKSRAAATAARIARGDVRKEAETSAQMRKLASDLGTREPEFDAYGAQLTKRLKALEAKYGKNDPAVTSFRIQMNDDLKAKALELGKKTPEYKATLKEQIAYFQEVLPTAGTQEIPSKRTGPVMRKLTSAPKALRVAGSRMTEKEVDAEVRAANEADGGVAYRLKEGEADTVVDAAEAQKIIDGLKLPDNVKFVYAPTTKNVPVRLLNLMAKDGVDVTTGGVRGAVFPDGTVLVIGDQHANVTDLEETVAHELIGHYGVDTLIGIERLNNFAKKTDVIDLAEKVGGKALVAEVLNTVRANAALGRSEEVQKLQALREIIAHTEEARVTESFRERAGRWLKELVGMVRAGLRDMGFKNLPELSTSDVFYMLKQSRKAFANKTIGAYRSADGQTAFRLRHQPSEYQVAREPGIVDKVMGNLLGLTGRVQFIDQYAALETAIRKGLDANIISDLEATNANYLLRFGQQRSQFAGQFLTNGPVKAEHVKKAGGVETIYRSTKGVSMLDVAKALNKTKIANDTELEDMFTYYLAGQRAEQVGWEKLNFENPADAKAKHVKLLNTLRTNSEAEAAFKEAAKLYQQYNAGLLDFLVDTGALSAKKSAELKAITYVPFYRVAGNGEVQLLVDKEHPVRIANIKDQPQLKELLGGNTAIMPVFTSAAQNTFMLTGMGLRNQAVKETAFTLKKLGIASAVRQGYGPTGSNVVRFFKNGEQHYALIDTDMYGVPAELIVRGMEGIKTTLPAVVKLLGMPADILRAFVVRNPAYAVRQIIRDPLNAWMTTGSDAVPVLSSMKELASMVAGRSEAERKLMETGAISSNVFSGDERDMSKFLKDIAAGKPMWAKAVAMLDTFALQGDAATRATIYKDSLTKGMTEQEALLRTLESMNFSRRGVSPSMQALSVLIPFFNAQIQGLDVIYRAMTGKMPYSEQLKIREKMVRRGALMAAGTLAYAAFMEDDEAYKRAKPEERYSSWFVYIPGVSEPMRVPIPFEIGFLFKALPEAIYNTAIQDDKADKAMSGIFKLAMQTVPLSLPQAVKPLTEAVLGKSFYGGDIESAREKEVQAPQRYRENTTELSKLIGSVTGAVGVSPITLDYLVRGYTGGLGIALIQLANPLLATEASKEIAKPTTKVSKTPFIGGLFQPVEGRGTLDEAYDRMKEIQQVKGTYNKLVEEGKRAEAMAFAQDYSNKLAMMSVSGSVQKRLGDLATVERRIRGAENMTTEQKDAALEQLDKAKIAIARQFLGMTQR